MDSQQEHVIHQVAQRDVRHVRLVFVDILGTQKSVTIMPGELERAFTEGMAFDGSSVEGFMCISKPDTLLLPDANTFQVVPPIGEDSADFVGRMSCDVFNPDGTQSHADPCYILERIMERVERLGFVPYIHPGIESYLFRPPASVEEELIPIDDGSYLDYVSGSVGNEFRRRAV